ncbi:MAG: Two component transcriptional regulator, winged helix family [Candidatus Moranbacteria bacterium GW2011_GWE2_35_2-]|nr:MAG: Two component transcriptional regulator, winged helix family [Candidatus Moranbacteria bacterium GW2011_GWE2_35_2-]KKQ05427.1 MAG: Two component transcriptional regulator, winged helix family [Candidatus Moranbacteria bacterium GW2011_GWF1_36_4]KKQ22630.1 MAG: Two component transcriptional regulator, winged helix family [Candidatus Moranbacteria bacterium GW2011_GWF2_37_11]KKQ29033.1 MAG: Two component transcriptional regulator, winged helix family [Candidatus Moranbacteria bacterium GW2
MQTKKRTILIVEDDHDLLEIYTQAFKRENFDVAIAKDGKEAWQHIKNNFNAVDLIISDIIMPKMDGFDLLEKIHFNDEYAKIPIIILTNLNQNGDRDAALALGAKKYFVKANITPKQLVGVVNEILRITSSQRKIV